MSETGTAKFITPSTEADRQATGQSFLLEIMIRSCDAENRLMMNTKFLGTETLLGIFRMHKQQKHPPVSSVVGGYALTCRLESHKHLVRKSCWRPFPAVLTLHPL